MHRAICHRTRSRAGPRPSGPSAALRLAGPPAGWPAGPASRAGGKDSAEMEHSLRAGGKGAQGRRRRGAAAAAPRDQVGTRTSHSVADRDSQALMTPRGAGGPGPSVSGGRPAVPGPGPTGAASGRSCWRGSSWRCGSSSVGGNADWHRAVTVAGHGSELVTPRHGSESVITWLNESGHSDNHPCSTSHGAAAGGPPTARASPAESESP